MTDDRIEREIVLPVPVERMWTALTDSGELSAWFGPVATVDLRPGGAATFGWETKRFHGVVTVVEPMRRFAYRWCLDLDTPVDEGPTTTVEFTLEAVEGGTRLQLVESGFASLSEGVRGRHLAQNINGWDDSFADLSKHLGVGMEV